MTSGEATPNETASESTEGYRGSSLRVLQRFDVKVGEKVFLRTKDGLETSGILLPRYEHADSQHIVLKLKSGYNIGISSSEVESISVIRGVSSSEPSEEESETGRNGIQQTAVGKHVSLLSTGGTIASRIDYRTGAVHPALSAQDLYLAVPELGQIAEIEPEVVFSAYSENLTPAHWQVLSERIVEKSRKKNEEKTAASIFNGIVVMMGTDTLAYTSAALSFSLIGLSVPVVVVGAQRSSDRPSSDSALNLKAAVRFAAYSERPGVYVAMHENENDKRVAIHVGSRVRKNHTTRRDAFRSVDVPYAALVTETKIEDVKGWNLARDGLSVDAGYALRTKFESRVSLVKFHPGMPKDTLQILARSLDLRGLVIEGTGMGHVSSDVVSSVRRLADEGISIFMTSQCIWGHVDLNVYETGRDLIKAGATPLGNMLPETAFAKMSWALGNFSRERLPEIMASDLVGELTSRILI